ncbi:uncharacterized protein K444DRAFT_613449 [Hyaloscypha bicolor E]|uniref:Uncharacterized protein n=1 Tax=Hyaloscypha bicolor E TaxID=1095630 RepID=A0A2J6T8Z5_9HELO|nr:uncharacterized protein K444DRAFT_613449 [Hyaloscypha bicolor E]PMD59492.1 hypothetical protein K444DRAFT_613449 [Hyaloscypha bicolor E]
MSTNPRHLEESPNNLALFMPYLHWETDRSRYKLEESMRRITEWHRTKEELKTREFKRFEEIEFLDPERPLLRLSTATETVQARLHHELRIHPMSKVSRTGVARELTGRILVPATLLGRVLYRAAKLWEAMNYYKEEHVLKEFLHNSPPLHPRRTLDQSYYWTLRSTQKKARDQVVYRGTAPKKQFMHKMHCKTFTKEPPCRQCLDDIRKRSRVIMVDQLWLWILDGNTIITSFPKRYGRDNEDTSDVHKCIRLRLKVARQNEIRSIYDLALIIIDECSKGMFDHAKTGGQQPQMMTLFADAISNVKDRTALYYENFWDITSRLSMAYKDQIPMVDAAKDARSLLDINPEGYLSTTIKNVVDELNIILDIKSNQQKALKDFQKHVDYILAPYMTIARDIGIDKQRGDERRVSTDSEERTKMDTQISRAAEKDAKWTMESSIRVSADLENRIIDLSHLKESAENIEKAVDGLLGLKQQQAGVVQAREAVRQAEETLRQGRSIMLFTVITIIFLPLTFGTGIFGMNLETFGSTWTLRKEITYITFVSAIVIATSIVLAFSSFVRSLLSLVFGVVWMWFVTTTRIYDLWYSFRQDSGFLARKQLDITRKWKEVARERYFLRQARKRERQEEKLKKLEAKLLKKEKEYLQGGRGRQAAQARDSTLTVLAV